jgi:glycogen(starch) synthase
MSPATPSPLLFEVAWEVCNQIGGIYTVLKTKAPTMLPRWGNNYFLVGPYRPEAASVEFEPGTPDEALRSAIQEVAKLGVKVHYGRWLIKGKPQVLLLEYPECFFRLADYKYFLWKDHGVSTSENDHEVNDCIVFGFAVFELLRAVSTAYRGRPMVAHFHEWMAGVAIPRLKFLSAPIQSVFTTHATLLGRYIASDNPNFYDVLDSIEPYGAARHYNIETRFSLERLAAQACDIFTTISRVTARETERFLGRKPDFLLPNGINLERFTALHEFQNLHLKYKERIHEFVMGHFFGSYSFELDRTLYFITSGRYEYRNKGMDIFIEALHRLNLRLKEIFDPPTIVAFIITKANVKSVNVGALQRHSMLDDLKHICTEVEAGIAKKLLSVVATGNFPEYEDLLPHDSQVRLKRAMHARKTSRLPAIVTHDLVDDGHDPILRHLRHRHLFNEPNDPVKVVFHPQFLSATSPLFNLDYDQFVRGCHLGVFPSYYEPWGYTPLECLALGIPTVTSDLTGFGDFAQNNISSLPQASLAESSTREGGIRVLRRSGVSNDQSIEELADFLFKFVQLNRRERIELRNKAERLGEEFDWARLAGFYHNAHVAALKRLGVPG